MTFSPEQEFNLFSVTAGAKKLANKAALWYVPCSLQNVEKIMEVPAIKVRGNSVAVTFIYRSLAFHPISFFLSLSVSVPLYANDMRRTKGEVIHERKDDKY